MSQEVLDPEFNITIPESELVAPDQFEQDIRSALGEKDPTQRAAKLGALMLSSLKSGDTVEDFALDVLSAPSEEGKSPATIALEQAQTSHDAAVEAIKSRTVKGKEPVEIRTFKLRVHPETGEVEDARFLTAQSKVAKDLNAAQRNSDNTGYGRPQNDSSFRSGRPVDPRRRK